MTLNIEKIANVVIETSGASLRHPLDVLDDLVGVGELDNTIRSQVHQYLYEHRSSIAFFIRKPTRSPA